MKSDKIRSLEERVRESAVFLYSKGVLKPEIGIILGSGLNDFADRIENPLIISYNDVPNMEAGLVSDHRGQVVYGEYKGKKVIIKGVSKGKCIIYAYAQDGACKLIHITIKNQRTFP